MLVFHLFIQMEFIIQILIKIYNDFLMIHYLIHDLQQLYLLNLNLNILNNHLLILQYIQINFLQMYPFIWFLLLINEFFLNQLNL